MQHSECGGGGVGGGIGGVGVVVVIVVVVVVVVVVKGALRWGLLFLRLEVVIVLVAL